MTYDLADPSRVSFLWDSRLTIAKGVFCKYSWFSPWELRVIKTDGFVPELIISPICHELRHMWQAQMYGTYYIWASLPYIREYTLEPTAIAAQDEVERLLGLKE